MCMDTWLRHANACPWETPGLSVFTNVKQQLSIPGLTYRAHNPNPGQAGTASRNWDADQLPLGQMLPPMHEGQAPKLACCGGASLF